MERKAFSAYNESSKRFLSRSLPTVDSAREPIKVLKILMEGPAPEDADGLWLINFRGVPVARSHNPYDLAYLDTEHRILQAVEITPSSRFVPFKGQPASALILPPGCLSRSQTFTGDHIQFAEVQVEVGLAPPEPHVNTNLFSRIVRATMVKTFNVPESSGQPAMHSGPLMRSAALSIKPPKPTAAELEHERLAARVAAATADGPSIAPAPPVASTQSTAPVAAVPAPPIAAELSEPMLEPAPAPPPPQPGPEPLSQQTNFSPTLAAPLPAIEPETPTSTLHSEELTELPSATTSLSLEPIPPGQVSIPDLPAVGEYKDHEELPSLPVEVATPIAPGEPLLPEPAVEPLPVVAEPAPIAEASTVASEAIVAPRTIDAEPEPIATLPPELPDLELPPPPAPVSAAETSLPAVIEPAPIEVAGTLPLADEPSAIQTAPAAAVFPLEDVAETPHSAEQEEQSPTARLVAALAAAAAQAEAGETPAEADGSEMANALYDIEPIALPDAETAAELEKTMPVARDVAALISSNVAQAAQAHFVVLVSGHSILYAKAVPYEESEVEQEENEELQAIREAGKWADEKLLEPYDLDPSGRFKATEPELLQSPAPPKIERSVPGSQPDLPAPLASAPAPAPESLAQPSSNQAAQVDRPIEHLPQPAVPSDSYTMRLIGEPVRKSRPAPSGVGTAPTESQPAVAPRPHLVSPPVAAAPATPRIDTPLAPRPSPSRPAAPPESPQPQLPVAATPAPPLPAEEPEQDFFALAPSAGSEPNGEEEQKTHKLNKRWDVKLLYSVFPDLHPDYRPDLETPEVNFKKDVGLGPQDKQSRRLQILNWLYPDLQLESVKKRQRQHRRAPRIPVPGLVGYFFTGGQSRPNEIRNISVMGFYMKTEERWMPGTVIRVTLQMIDSDGENPGDSITVLSRVVNWDSEGGGFEFVLPGLID